MDERERRANLDRVRPWVAACVAFLHLDRWTWRLEGDPPGEGGIASVERWVGQLDFSLRLDDRFFTLNEREQREVLAHELCHVHLRPVWEVWRDLDEMLGKPAYAMLRNHATIAEEQAVESLARVLAPLLPPPPPAPTLPEEGR